MKIFLASYLIFIFCQSLLAEEQYVILYDDQKEECKFVNEKNVRDSSIPFLSKISKGLYISFFAKRQELKYCVFYKRNVNRYGTSAGALTLLSLNEGRIREKGVLFIIRNSKELSKLLSFWDSTPSRQDIIFSQTDSCFIDNSLKTIKGKFLIQKIYKRELEFMLVSNQDGIKLLTEIQKKLRLSQDVQSLPQNSSISDPEAIYNIFIEIDDNLYKKIINLCIYKNPNYIIIIKKHNDWQYFKYDSGSLNILN